MCVELVYQENPTVLRCGFEGIGEMIGKVKLLASGANGGGNHGASGYMPIGNQTQGAMPFVLIFQPSGLSWLHGLVWMQAFQGLNAGHLISTDQMNVRIG